MSVHIKNKENKDLICILMKAFNGSINNKEMCDTVVRIKHCWRLYWKIYVDLVYKKWKCHTLTKYKKFFMFGKIKLLNV